MAEDEIEDQMPQEESGHNPFEKQHVDDKIVPLNGLYQNWFLDYASYVILERAVPSLYDGLKPVQRRILHSMREMEDGRYNLILEGTARFRLVRELDVTTAYRQAEAEFYDEDEEETLTHAQRGGFEREARRFADMQGYSVDWDSVERLDDRSLINGVSQIAPFDPASKQALLEAETLTDRCELLVQLMQFFGRTDGSEEITTLQ